jgi:hypothetical protein
MAPGRFSSMLSPSGDGNPQAPYTFTRSSPRSSAQCFPQAGTETSSAGNANLSPPSEAFSSMLSPSGDGNLFYLHIPSPVPPFSSMLSPSGDGNVSKPTQWCLGVATPECCAVQLNAFPKRGRKRHWKYTPVRDFVLKRSAQCFPQAGTETRNERSYRSIDRTLHR